MRTKLYHVGARPNRVSVYRETVPTKHVGVQHRRGAHRVTKRFADTTAGRAEAKAYAHRLAALLERPAEIPSPTLAELWARYQDAEFDALRPKTCLNYRQHWRVWETFAGPETRAATVSRERLDECRRALRARGIAVSQQRKIIELVKRVYRFAVDRELLAPTRLTEYTFRVAKEERPAPTAEYKPEDALKLIAAFDPAKSTQWRAWAFCVLAHYTGARTNAILHLQFADLAPGATRVLWRAEHDKTGRERWQPLPAQAIEAIRVALDWAAKDEYTGDWVLYTPRQKARGDAPLTYRAIWWQMREAEERAGVAHVKWNAMHRWRRTAFGNVRGLAGFEAAMEWIGDTSVKAAQVYNKSRSERLDKVAEMLSEGEPGHDGTASGMQSGGPT